MTDTTINHTIERRIKAAIQMDTSSVGLLVALLVSLNLGVYVTGLVSGYAALVSGVVPLATALLVDRFKVGIVVRAMRHPGIRHLQKAHQKVAMWLGLLVVILYGIHMSLALVPEPVSLVKTLQTITVMIGIICLGGALLSLKPDQSRLEQLQALRKTLSDTKPAH